MQRDKLAARIMSCSHHKFSGIRLRRLSEWSPLLEKRVAWCFGAFASRMRCRTRACSTNMVVRACAGIDTGTSIPRVTHPCLCMRKRWWGWMGFRVKVRQGTFIPSVIDPATKGAEEATICGLICGENCCVSQEAIQP